jgi:Fibronectin type III domain
MKRKPPDSRNALSALRLSLALSLATLVPLLLYGSAPSWWSSRGVLVEHGVADDYAPANQGQLKNIAKAAVAEMDAKLPGGAGETLHQLVAGWSIPSSQTNDFAPVNLGQLKSVAKPFYDRLISNALATEYPWTNASNATDDFAVANLGQVKKLFSFELPAIDPLYDGDNNGLPDAWELQYFGAIGVDPNADSDGDGVTNLQEYLYNTDPTDFYDGMLETLTISGGGDQRGQPGTHLSVPISVRVNRYGAAGAPITFEVMSGGALLMADDTGSAPLASSLVVRSDPYDDDGYSAAQVYVVLSSTPGISVIRASAAGGGRSASVQTTAVAIDATLSPPTNLSVTPTSPSTAEVTWIPASDASSTTLQVSTDGGKTWITIGTVPANATKVTVTGLVPGQTTSFRVFSGGTPVTNSTILALPPPGQAPPPPSPGPGGDAALPVETRTVSAPVLEEDQAKFFYGIRGGYPGLRSINRDLYKTKTIVTTSEIKYDDGTIQSAGTTTKRFVYIPGHESFGLGGQEVITVSTTGDGGTFASPYDTTIWTNTVLRLDGTYLPRGSTSSQTTTLSDPYTDADAKADGEGAILKFWGEFLEVDPQRTEDASFFGTGGHYDLVVAQYHFRVNSDPDLIVTWDVQFKPYDGGEVQHDVHTWASHGNIQSPDFTLDPRQLNDGANGSYLISIIQAELMVDGNHDGELSFENQTIHAGDETSEDKPYRFWLNNDHDDFHTVDGDDSEYDDISDGSKDCDYTTIGTIRDLEDFTRLRINVKGMRDLIRDPETIVTLEWRSVSGDEIVPSSDGVPEILVYEEREPDVRPLYLEDEGTALRQRETPFDTWIGGVRAGQPMDLCRLRPALRNPLSEPTSYLSLLFCGKTAGRGELVLVVKRRGLLLFQSPPVYIELLDVKDMYERWTVGDVPAANSSIFSPVDYRYWPDDHPTLLESPSRREYSPPADEAKDYVLWIHGWNMSPFDKDSYGDTTFKRLFWQGYKGRFGTFRWPTYYFTSDIPPVHHFDASEHRAWASSLGLVALLNRLNDGPFAGRIRMMAHSMGNVVAGEALRRSKNGQIVHTYVASQAALSAHCYDAGAPQMRYEANLGPVTPNVYAFYWHEGTSTPPHKWESERSASYFAAIYMQGKAGSYFNYYNEDDWALTWPRWQLDQQTKPDADYGYTYNGFGASEGFWRDRGTGANWLSMPADTFEIFSWAAESRSYALGAQWVSGVVAQNVDLKGPPFLYGPAHKFHSGQFRGTNMERRHYWQKMLIDCGLKEPQ